MRQDFGRPYPRGWLRPRHQRQCQQIESFDRVATATPGRIADARQNIGARPVPRQAAFGRQRIEILA